MIKHYENDEIIVTWNPNKCEHAAFCFKGSNKVFNPNRKPWIDLSQATTEEIIKIIDQCPSGALSYKKK
ncbi:MAG: (4Fe-4S)-binding protein [Paludibacteraceae bacterium]|jgi:uncharacterized Fe-S cluster protein YjdI|nr:(4Fe-4S)-binding protein [Paludibacteraceae bacterium]